MLQYSVPRHPVVFVNVFFFLFITRNVADCCRATAAMIDAVYRGNIEELLSVFNHLKRYIIAFAVVLLVLISVFHFSKYSVHVVPLITVALILLPTAYYSVVLVVKFIDILVASDQTVSISAATFVSSPRSAILFLSVEHNISRTTSKSKMFLLNAYNKFKRVIRNGWQLRTFDGHSDVASTRAAARSIWFGVSAPLGHRIFLLD